MFGSKTGAWTAARMLAPMSLENFLSSCWAEKPLVVPFLGFDSCEIQVAPSCTQFHGHVATCCCIVHTESYGIPRVFHLVDPKHNGTEVHGPLQRLTPIISHMRQLDLQELLEETPSEQAPMAWLWNVTSGNFTNRDVAVLWFLYT